ncbi:MAG: hypothetical protein KDC12_02975 [Flavobacteriales bacterium]|nr:hypothetical protein [Flavobacteriales bacterium]
MITLRRAVLILTLFLPMLSGIGQDDPVSALHREIDNARLDDSLRVRNLFEWITSNISYDYGMYRRISEGKDSREQSAEDVARKRKGVCEGYANLFAALCQKSGFRCEVIEGHARGGVYGKRDQGELHAWNAVQINKRWYILDCTWAAGYVDGKGKFHFERNEHFWLTNPEEMTDDHYPFDPLWQLNAHPITFDEFTHGKTTGSGIQWDVRDSLIAHYRRNAEARESVSVARILMYDPENSYFLLQQARDYYNRGVAHLEIQQNRILAIRGTGKKLEDPDWFNDHLDQAEVLLKRSQDCTKQASAKRYPGLESPRAESLHNISEQLKYVVAQRKWIKKYFRKPGPIN